MHQPRYNWPSDLLSLNGFLLQSTFTKKIISETHENAVFYLSFLNFVTIVLSSLFIYLFKYIYTCICTREESLCIFHTIRLGECRKHYCFIILMYLLPVTLQQQQHSNRSCTAAAVLRTPSRWDAMVVCKLKTK